MNRKLQISAVILVLTFSSAAYAEAEGHFERTLKVSGHVDLDVQSGSGNITVHPGDSSSVVVQGHIKAGSSWFSSGGLGTASASVTFRMRLCATFQSAMTSPFPRTHRSNLAPARAISM